MDNEKAPTFSGIAGCDLQNFVLPKKGRSRSGARGAATSVFELPISAAPTSIALMHAGPRDRSQSLIVYPTPRTVVMSLSSNPSSIFPRK